MDIVNVQGVNKLWPESLYAALSNLWHSPCVYSWRALCFKMIDHHLTDHYFERKLFESGNGYKLQLAPPKSFNQKIVWKKLYNRNPLLTVTADKYKVRKFVRNVLGTRHANEILVPLLYTGKDPENIPFDALPEDYVAKTNHNSGPPVFVRKDQRIKRGQIVKELNNQIRKPYGILKNEWAYRPIKRRVIVEASLLDENGRVPVDYKFFMFHGKCYLVQVDRDRFTDSHSRTFFDQDWNRLKVQKTEKLPSRQMGRPSTFGEMRYIARQLSNSFDFVRVDLYGGGEKVYFGELTHYPMSGWGKFYPVSFDFELGGKWRLCTKYGETV